MLYIQYKDFGIGDKVFFIQDFGYKDFAGSGTVHLVGGACALAAALFIGPRVGKYGKQTGTRFGIFPKAKTNKLYGANIPIAALVLSFYGWVGLVLMVALN